MALTKKTRDILIVIAALFAVFGGVLFATAEPDRGQTWMNVLGGVLVGGFVLLIIIWFVTQPKKSQ